LLILRRFRLRRKYLIERHVSCNQEVRRQQTGEEKMSATVESETMRGGVESSKRAGEMRPTILLVEDEPGVREVTREALELGGYRVLTADGPASAKEIARDAETPIDLMLTDVVMPGMNGPELARQARELRPELVTLFMTGYADSEVLKKAKLSALCVSTYRSRIR
jgi:CheY-like chemotaxis protein